MLIYIYCWVVLVLHMFASLCSAGTRFHRIAYIHVATDDWAQYQQLFDGTYTHIITAFLVPDNTGQLLAVDAAQSFPLTLIHKAQAAGTRVLVAIGGASVSYQIYLDIARNPSVRQRFIQNVIRFVHERGHDGVDLNFEGWFEGLTTAQRDEGNDLMRELARAVKSRSTYSQVTVPLAPLYWLPMSANCALANSPWIDMAHHMSYDFDVGNNGANGPWRGTGTQQYLYPGYAVTERSVWGALQYLLNQSCRADKLTAGIPFYNTVKEPWEAIEHRHDWRRVPLHPQFLEKADPRSGVWVTDPQAVATKVQAYQQLGLAGVLVWQVGQEGTAATLSRALLAAALGRALPDDVPAAPSPSALPRRDVPASPPDIQAREAMTQLTIRSDWGSGYCADVQVSNPLPSSLLWQVSLTASDTITTLWDAVYSQQGNVVVIRGVAWNRILAPRQSTAFGFCATRQQ
jgi:glycosyl hydrolase family 18 (putative chitinase)/cellulose binding protein with CBM2 domain